MSEKWEYKLCRCDLQNNEEFEFMKLLDRLGREGYEAIGMTTRYTTILVLLKRPIFDTESVDDAEINAESRRLVMEEPMKILNWFRRKHPLIGKRICVVRMDGCMAHIRGKEESGTVQWVVMRHCGAFDPIFMAQLAMDDGTYRYVPVCGIHNYEYQY